MLPVKSIRVAGHDVPLLLRDPDDDSFLDDNRGYWDGPRERIVLSTKDHEQKRKEVALHELFHCIESVVSMDLGEDAVRRFSRVLFGILQDNPELSAWLIAAEKVKSKK